MTTRLILYDDDVARSWLPFSATRPVGEMLFGTELLRERSARLLQTKDPLYLSDLALKHFHETNAPRVITTDEPGSGSRIFLSTRLVLAGAPDFDRSKPTSFHLADGRCVGVFCPVGVPCPAVWEPPSGTSPADLGTAQAQVDGFLLENPWDLMARNAAQIVRDADGLLSSPVPEGVHVFGDHGLHLGPGVEIEPGVVIDLTSGPVLLEANVRIQALTRLAGPAYVGEGSTILGGFLGEVSIGPVCKIRGEVECSVILGYSNKAHDGFLGHAVVGKWVNLGAMTTNSDLKNNYGEVRLQIRDTVISTGSMKVGSLLGDHVRTGIGTLLTTGSVVEAASNLFGGVLAPKYVPPFSWGVGTELAEYQFEKFLETASRAMSRRGVQLDEGTQELYKTFFEHTRNLRRP